MPAHPATGPTHPTPASPGAGFLRIEGLSHGYKVGETGMQVLRDVNLSIPAGEFLAISGPSGCGKTTLLNLLGGLETPSAGLIEVQGQTITGLDRRGLAEYRRLSVAFIFQFYNLLPNLTAAENIAAGLEVLPLPRRTIRDRVAHYLREVGLEGQGDRFPGQLSGGMQQRVAIARALAKHAKLILADEPTGNLDQDTGASIMDLIQEVHTRSSATLLLITHDPAVAARAGRIVQIRNGRIEPEVP